MFNSIRTKLTLWYVGVLAAVVIAFSTTAFFILVNALNREMDERLVEMARNFNVALMAELEDEDRATLSEKTLSEAVNEMRFRDYQFIIATRDGRAIASTAEFGVEATSHQGTETFRNVEINDEAMRVNESPLTIGQNEFRLFVFHSLKEQNTLKSRIAAIFLIGVPLSLLMAGFGGYFLARKSLAPMVEMSRQAAAISAQNLSERISIKNKHDELGDLARVFNELLARLDAAFEQQRRFMADASHELRTPLAIVRGEAEVSLSRRDRQTDDYRESLNVVHDESKRLTSIVEDLFTLARADAGQFRVNLAPVYLDEIVGEAIRSMRVLANQKNIGLSLKADAEMPFNGDESLLRRLFLNILDNAVKYTPNGGRISVACMSVGTHYHITVTDDGIGIPGGEQSNIFDRFYRVDKARSRAGDTEATGAGLGLSIAKWIAEIHGGDIKLVSSNNDGSVFLIEFSIDSGEDGLGHEPGKL